MAREATNRDFQADLLPPRHMVVSSTSGCARCGGQASVLPSSRSRFCESCVFTWAFEPCKTSLDVTDSDPLSNSDAQVIGHYVLVEEIGRGGMGVIYRAVHRERHEVVALKTVLPQHADNQEILARFQREAETAQSLEHPHTISILEVGCSEGGLPFFTMPLASGGSLHHLSPKYRGRWRRIAELMVKVARAVHHAHQRGILHRDIKPGNILFTEDHEPLVADFGLARSLTNFDDLTRSCDVLGTPHYVAPEQAAGRTLELTQAVDIYSLGAVFFELLTTQPPFMGGTPLDVLRQVNTKSPVRPRRLVPTVPKALEQICLRCLERVPTNRYASALALADDLERWLDGRAVTPQPKLLRLRSYFGRHPVAGAWGSLAIALLIALPFALRTIVHDGAVQPIASVAMVIDDLEPSAASKRISQQLANQLGRQLTDSHKFRLQEQPSGSPAERAASLDPVAFGRSISAQAVLTSYLHQSCNRLHLVTQLVRCDTGETIWKHRDVLSLDQAAVNLTNVTKELVGRLQQSWRDSLKNKARINPQQLPEAQNFYIRAMELAAHGSHQDMEAAIGLLQRARKIDPHFAQACAMLALSQWTMGFTYGESKQFALAEETAKDALALDPDSAQAHRVIASCYQQRARYDEARAEFETAVELAPTSAGCCQSLGICLREMGHPDQAIPWLQRAVQLEPAHGSFSTSLGEALILCDLDAQAEAALTHAAELNPERVGSQFAMVALRVWQKRYDEARELCAAASHRFPDYRFKLDFAAWVEFCDGRLSEAQGYYETLRAENAYLERWAFHGGINPASALACIALRSGSVEQARMLADEALLTDRALLEKYPSNNRILHDIAATYAVLGDEENALHYLEQALTAGWAEHRSTSIDPRFNAFIRLVAFKTLLESTKPKYNADSD